MSFGLVPWGGGGVTSMPPVWPCCSPTAASPLCPCGVAPPRRVPISAPPGRAPSPSKGKKSRQEEGCGSWPRPLPSAPPTLKPRPRSALAPPPSCIPRPLIAGADVTRYKAPSPRPRPRAERDRIGAGRCGAVQPWCGAGMRGMGAGMRWRRKWGGGEVGYLGGGGCRDGWGTECGGVRCGAVRCRGFNSVRCPLTAALSPQCDFSEEQTAGE